MSNQSTIEALKAALQEVEEKKRRIDEDHRGLLIALRYFDLGKVRMRRRMTWMWE